MKRKLRLVDGVYTPVRNKVSSVQVVAITQAPPPEVVVIQTLEDLGEVLETPKIIEPPKEVKKRGRKSKKSKDTN